MQMLQDIYSYNIEQAQGDTCNIITAAMQEFGLDMQGSIDHAAKLVRDRIAEYELLKGQLPNWDDVKRDVVLKYLKVCEDWMIAGFEWSLISKRYFGEKVQDVKATLSVDLLPFQERVILPELVPSH